MDLSKVLAELRQELERLDSAIVSLERLKEEGRSRRGRPPKTGNDDKDSGAAGLKRSEEGVADQ